MLSHLLLNFKLTHLPMRFAVSSIVPLCLFVRIDMRSLKEKNSRFRTGRGGGFSKASDRQSSERVGKETFRKKTNPPISKEITEILRDRCGDNAYNNKYEDVIIGFEYFQNNCHLGHCKFTDECLTSDDLSASLSQSSAYALVLGVLEEVAANLHILITPTFPYSTCLLANYNKLHRLMSHQQTCHRTRG